MENYSGVAARDDHIEPSEPSEERTGRRDSLIFSILSLYSASIACATGILVMMIWLIQVRWIEANIPLLYACKFNTALGLTLGGIAVIAINLKRVNLARAAAAIMAAIAFLTLLEYMLDMDLGLDQAFVDDNWHPDAAFPGRMSLNSIACFLLTSLTLFLLTLLDHYKWQTLAIVPQLLVLFVSISSLGGYFSGLPIAYTWGTSTQISPQTALGFLFITVGLLTHTMGTERARLARIPRWWIAAIYSMFVFWFDLATPLGVATGIAYVPLVVMSLWARAPRMTFVLAAVATGLIVAGYAASPPAIAPAWTVLMNRLLSIGAIWFTAIVVYISQHDRLAREESDRHLNAIFEAALDGMITIDSHGMIEKFNSAAAKMLGYAAEDVIGKNVNILMPEPYHSAHDSYLRRFMATNERHIIGTGRSVSARRKDGSVFPIDLGVSEIRDRNRKSFVGTIRDISEREQTERNIQKHMAALKASNKELDEFAYIASHDLQEPLSSLSNHAQVLQAEYEGRLEPDGERRLKRMTFLSQRLERLIDDLLHFSRLGSNKLSSQKTDLYSVIADIEALLDVTLKQENAIISVPNPLPYVVCDRPRILEVFRNLIINAIRYNDQDSKWIEIGHFIRDSERVFYVKDNGIGIAEEHYEDVFLIFKRLNVKEGVEGAGAGLTFVKKIIQRHNGRIWVESEVGQGSIFYFTLGEPNEEGSSDRDPFVGAQMADDAPLLVRHG